MVKPQIIEEIPINITEVKAELSKIKKRDGELTYRGNKTEEFLKEFATLSQKDAKVLYEKLEGLKISRLRDIHFQKVIDILPKSVEEVKVVLQGYNITVKEESLKKIASVVEEVVGKN